MTAKNGKGYNLSLALQRIVADSLRVLKADRGALYLLQPQDDALRLETSIGLSETFINALLSKWKELPTSSLLREEGVHFFQDVKANPRFAALKSDIETEGFRSVAIVPLAGGDTPLGSLVLYFDEIRELTEEEQSSIQTFGELAAIAIENGLFYDREKEASRRLERLQELSLQVSSTLDLPKVLDAIAKATVDLLSGSQARIYLLDHHSGFLKCHASFGFSREIPLWPEEMPLGVGLGGWVAQNRGPLLISDMQTDSRALGKDWARTHGTHAFVGVPLLSSDNLLGVITCLSTNPGQFNQTDLHLLESLASHAVSAIEKATLFERAQKEFLRLSTLNETSKKITSSLDLEQTLDSILMAAKNLTACDFVRIWLKDEKSKRGTCRAALNPTGTSRPKLELTKGMGLTGWVLEREEIVAVRDIKHDPRWTWTKIWSDETDEPSSYLGIPMFSKGKIMGCLVCLSGRPRDWSQNVVEVVEGLASQAAVAIENAWAFEEIRIRSDRQEALRRVTWDITQNLDLTELFSRICQSVSDLLKLDCARLFVKDEITGELHQTGFYGELPGMALSLTTFPPGKGVIQRVVSEKRTVAVADVRNDPDWFEKEVAEQTGIRGFLGAPLILKDEVVGGLSCFTTTEREFRTDEIELIQDFATQAVVALENARAFREIQLHSERQEALRKVTLEVTANLDLKGLFSKICESVCKLLDVDVTRLLLLDEETDTFITAGVFGSLDDMEGTKNAIHRGKGLLSRVVETKGPVVIPEVGKDPAWLDFEWAEKTGLKSYLGIPLFLDDQIVGVLNSFTTQRREFKPDEIELLSVFSVPAIAALRNARLYKEVKNRATNLEVLDEIAKAMNSTLDLGELLKITVEQAKRALSCDRAGLCILGPDKNHITGYFGVDDDKERENSFDIPKTIAGTYYEEILHLRKPLYTPDYLKSPNSRHQRLVSFGFRSGINVPIISDGEVIGFLNVGSAKVDAYPPEHIQLLRSVADHLAIAMKNANLYAEARTRTTNLEIMDEIAQAMNSTLDLEELFNITVEQVKRAVPCERCALATLSSDKTFISDYFAIDESPERAEKFEKPREVTGPYEEMMRSLKPIYCPNTLESPYTRHHMLATTGICSTVNVPVMTEGEVIGFLNVASSKLNAYPPEHIQLLGSVADHLAIAMRNAELYARVRETSRRLDSLIRNAKDGIITVDTQGKINSWNPAAETIYGYKEAEVLGEDVILIYFDPESAEKERAKNLKRVSSGENAPPWETLAKRKDGTPFEVSINLSAIQDGSGQLIGFSGIHRDITERKRAEEAIRKSEEKYRTLFEDARDAIEIVDEEGWIIDCNQHACDLLGYTRDEMLEKRVQEITASTFRDSVTGRIRRIINKGMSPYESINVRKDGTLVNIEVSATPIEFEGRKHVIYFIRDTTERKQAELDLERFRAILDQTGEALNITDLKTGRFVDVNETACRMLGYTREELLELGPQDVETTLAIQTPAEWEAHIQFLKQADQTLIFDNCVNRRKDGSTFPVEVSISYRTFGGRDYLVSVVRDVSQRKSLEEQLRQSQKLEALGRFASGVAHDINNALALILSRTELLSRNKEYENLLPQLELIKKAAMGGAKTVTRLQDFARKREDRPKGRADLNQVIRDVVDMSRPRWKNEAELQGNAFQVEVEDLATQPIVRGDETELHEALINLVNNSLDAMPDGGRITLRTENVGDEVCVTISDAGQGMTGEQQQRVFDPFYTTKGDRGTGLGLSMVYSIVERHSGRIELESAPGKGASFRMTFPVSAGEIPEQKDSSPPSSTSRRILIIDDEEEITELFGEILKQAGHTVEGVTDPLEGLNLIQSGSFDMVFTDLGMPGMPGWEIAKSVKQHNSEIAVVLITGWGAEFDETKLADNGVDLVLSKPVKTSDLLKAAAELFSNGNKSNGTASN